MACGSEMDSDEAWAYYLQLATEQEACDSLCEVLRLARNFGHQHKPTSDRMYKMLAVGEAIYVERFGTEWAPF